MKRLVSALRQWFRKKTQPARIVQLCLKHSHGLFDDKDCDICKFDFEEKSPMIKYCIGREARGRFSY